MKTIEALVLGAVAASVIMSTTANAESVTEALRGLAPSSMMTRIVGGEATSRSEWPWQMALYRRAGKDHDIFTCGGALIAPNWVLTAAHCFGGKDSKDASAWTVVTDIPKLALIDVAEGATTRKVKRIVVHERYGPKNFENDIALIELVSPIEKPTITPQMVVDGAMESNRPATVIGWGSTRWLVEQDDKQGRPVFMDGETKKPVPISDIVSPDLRRAAIPLVDVAKCSAIYRGGEAVVDERNLCAGLPKGGVDSCQGDSGGPLMTKAGSGEWRQIGIVSWGKDCARPNYPGVYTRVSAFGDWIRGVLGRDLVLADQSPAQAPIPQASEPTPEATATQTPVAADSKPDPAVDNAAGLTIAFDQGDEVEVGELVAYRVTTQKPGYLAIFDATPDGQLTQIYPNALSLRSPTSSTLDTTLIGPGRPLLVPNYKNDYRGFRVNVLEPRGAGTMVAILADKPINAVQTPDQPKTFATPEAARAAIQRIHDELARRLQVRAGIEGHPDWSVAFRGYVVR